MLTMELKDWVVLEVHIMAVKVSMVGVCVCDDDDELGSKVTRPIYIQMIAL
jgi:hypothetical protein